MSSTFGIVPLIPGLVNEVALEIFLYFVAIDRDGPSTLVLVCTAWRDVVLGSKFLQSLRRKRRRPNPALGETRNKLEEGICIVSFDGGGPGSMSQLRMLEEFMARLAFKERAEADELLPADYFDLMGGVGFGGLVALLLGRLRMTTSQAMEELARIGTATFPEGDDMVSQEVNIVRLRQALESMLKRNGHSVEIKLRDSSENRCKVVVFAATTAVMDHCHPFRTYRSPRKCVDCTLIDAACASMATPDYFPSVAVGLWPRRQSFAGIPHNFHNPMREVLKEAKLVFGEKNPVSLVLSLGAGQPARHYSPDHQVTRRSRVHCDGVARDLQDQLSGFSEYLRLNVDKGMENIELDNWHELGSIETYTDVYLEMNQITRYIDEAIQLLLERNGSVTLGNLNGTNVDCVVKFYPESLEKYLAMEFKQMSDVIRGLGIEKVTLVDAIGNDIPIPKHFCPTYAMLLDVIKVYFRHQNPPGSDLVERGDYRLLHGSRRSIVDPVEWDQLEKVRLKVEMSMILRTHNNDKARCPRCRTQSEAPPINGWATCASCSGQFQIEDQLLEYKAQSGDDSHNEEVHAEENSILTPSVKEFIQASQGKSPKKVNKKIAKEEELKYRLISVVNLLDTLSRPDTAMSGRGDSSDAAFEYAYTPSTTTPSTSTVQLRRSSGSSQGKVLQQSAANYAQFQQRVSTIQEYGKLAVKRGNTIRIRQARDAAAEVQKKSNEERERWMRIIQQVHASNVNDNVAKQVESWFVRYQKLYERADHLVKSLETAIQSIQQQQQQQQAQQQYQNAANMMSRGLNNLGVSSPFGDLSSSFAPMPYRTIATNNTFTSFRDPSENPNAWAPFGPNPLQSQSLKNTYDELFGAGTSLSGNDDLNMSSLGMGTDELMPFSFLPDLSNGTGGSQFSRLSPILHTPTPPTATSTTGTTGPQAAFPSIPTSQGHDILTQSSLVSVDAMPAGHETSKTLPKSISAMMQQTGIGTFGPPVNPGVTNDMVEPEVCAKMSLPDVTKLNLDIGTAWRAVRQHPQFEECDIDELCAELAQNATCAGTNKVIEAQRIMDIVHSIPERARRYKMIMAARLTGSI